MEQMPVKSPKVGGKDMSSELICRLDQFCQRCEQFGVRGLLFQHVHLCLTRLWLHYHRVDCAHLNRHMKEGSVIHSQSYSRRMGKHEVGDYGVPADWLDFAQKQVNEVKKSKSHEKASMMQLGYYVACMTDATGQLWSGVLRYPALRRTIPVVLDCKMLNELDEAVDKISRVVNEELPPKPELKPLCKHCSYRIVCWNQSTEDEDD